MRSKTVIYLDDYIKTKIKQQAARLKCRQRYVTDIALMRGLKQIEVLPPVQEITGAISALEWGNRSVLAVPDLETATKWLGKAPITDSIKYVSQSDAMFTAMSELEVLDLVKAAVIKDEGYYKIYY